MYADGVCTRGNRRSTASFKAVFIVTKLLSSTPAGGGSAVARAISIFRNYDYGRKSRSVKRLFPRARLPNPQRLFVFFPEFLQFLTLGHIGARTAVTLAGGLAHDVRFTLRPLRRSLQIRAIRAETPIEFLADQRPTMDHAGVLKARSENRLVL